MKDTGRVIVAPPPAGESAAAARGQAFCFMSTGLHWCFAWSLAEFLVHQARLWRVGTRHC
jgi:hypothetical protein